MSARSIVALGKSPIATALVESTLAVRETGPNAWTVVLSTGTRVKVRADAGAGWLVLDAPVPTSAGGRASRRGEWEWLQWNDRPDGGAKIALPPHATSPRLRLDIALDEEALMAPRVRDACAAMARAAGELRGASDGRADQHAASDGSDTALDLHALCTEAGWTFTEREGSRVSVDLGGERRPAHAVLESLREGSARARVEILRREALTPSSRQALGTFLLTGSAIVRLARAYVDEGADQVSAGFDAPCPSSCTASDVGHALSSLSVAWAMFGTEAVALADDRVARAYLAVRGAVEIRAKHVWNAGVRDPNEWDSDAGDSVDHDPADPGAVERNAVEGRSDRSQALVR